MDVVAPNEWTQVGSPEWTQQIDDGMLNTQMSSGGGILAAASPAMAAMAAAGGAAAGGSTAAGGQQQQQQQQALRCPRCDSSNTKFCYYNNYSLSQPRHFCKACKRYWTRGGTLRNVPVGGGCRKNKRVKKPNTTTNSSSSASSPSAADPSPSPLPSLPFLPNPTAISSASPSPDLGFLLYSLANSGSDGTQLGFPGLRQESMPCSPYGALPTQLGLLGLGYQSINPDELDYLPSLKAHTQVTQTAPTSTAPPLLQEYPVFGSHAASLLASTLRQHQQQHHHHKLVQNPDLSPYASGSFQLFRDVKLEGGGDASGVMGGGARNTSDWQLPPCENAIVDDAEPSLYWNGVWPDHAATCGPYSSLAPLI